MRILKGVGVGLLFLFAVMFFIARMPQGGSLGGSNAAITMAEYSALQNGITYAQAVQIIGEGGTEVSSSNLAGIKTVMYSWKNPNGSNMNAMFQNDAMIQKAQFGLK